MSSKCQPATHATKLTVLSAISQIYDPLGLLSPYIIIIKILIKKLWLYKIGWDDPIPQPALSTWQSFVNKLKYLNDLRIPRHARAHNANRTDLHIFSDSSNDAYGACAYIRSYTSSVSGDSSIQVSLLCAKSKVAPVKTVSIPRLELCGAMVGAQLYDKIKKSLRLTFDNVYFWSDSTIVIG